MLNKLSAYFEYLVIGHDCGAVCWFTIILWQIVYSVKHNTYTIINTKLATCFGSSEPSSGQLLTDGHGALSECANYGIPYCLQTIFILKFKLKICW